MPTYKASVIFDAPGTGWSENYYVTATDAERGVASFAGTWLELRMALIGRSDLYVIKCISIRVQNVLDPLDNAIQAQNSSGTYPSAEGDDPEMPWSGILARATTVEGPKRAVKLLGVPDSVCNGSWRTLPSNAGWGKAFEDFRKVCIRRGLLVQSINEAANPLIAIDTVAVGAGFLTVTTKAAHGLTDNNYMAFNRVSSAAKLVGRHRVYDVAGLAFKVKPYNYGSVGFVEGKLRKITYEYKAWDDIQLLRKTKRPTGRPFFLLRGRR